MKLTSTAFAEGEKIPNEYTMYGENRIPPLEIQDIPAKARSLALIVDDPDAPKGTFNHWLMFNIDTKTHRLDEKSIPAGSVQGRNDFGDTKYGGPKPPSGEHRYFFKIHALDSTLALPAGVKRAELDAAMQGHVLEQATLMGKYAH